ncbi:MAG: hypothetical protein BYD32DRAFT_429441 [Podila humilis]|nr:MAG: hypothetical protein BYD32DRAFT_429441 [Podila humilis]
MTPRTHDHVIDNNFHQGQAHPSVVHIATAPSVNGTNGAYGAGGPGSGDPASEDGAYLTATYLTGSTNFVTSPISFQPPTGSMSSTSGGYSDGFQSMYSSSILLGDSTSRTTTEHQTESSLHRSNTLAASREALLQQQRYQQQQFRQFQESTECDTSSPTPSTISTKTVGVSMTTPTSSSTTTTTMNTEDISTHSVSAAQSAIALARATAQASVEPPSLPTSPSYTNTSFPLSHHLQDDYHRRERVISSQGSVFGSDLLHNGGPGGGAFSPSPITRASTSLATSHLITHDLRQTAERSHIEDGSGPVVLMAVGKTGQGKSSLLNRIMGTSELKASASVRAVTKGIAERTGWGRFEDSRRVLVTLADTPGKKRHTKTRSPRMDHLL